LPIQDRRTRKEKAVFVQKDEASRITQRKKKESPDVNPPVSRECEIAATYITQRSNTAQLCAPQSEWNAKIGEFIKDNTNVHWETKEGHLLGRSGVERDGSDHQKGKNNGGSRREGERPGRTPFRQAPLYQPLWRAPGPGGIGYSRRNERANKRVSKRWRRVETLKESGGGAQSYNLSRKTRKPRSDSSRAMRPRG